jgi:uncharacterized repeat protein (TIGR03803 family)
VTVRPRVLGLLLAVGIGAVAAKATAQSYRIVTAFFPGDGAEGATPYAGLTPRGRGTLVGTTFHGGVNGSGAIFKIHMDGSGLEALHSFAESDGSYPAAGLLKAADGALYGTTYLGGAYGDGTIFRLAPDLTFAVLHSFAYSDGAFPLGGLIQGTDGNLYGATTGGLGCDLPYSCGTVFRIDPNGASLTTLHRFSGADGMNPLATLLQGADGNLYGTTYRGGPITFSCPSGCGTIFRIDTAGGAFTSLHEFLGSDGAGPDGDLIQATDGYLYGTTQGGGASGYGTIFRMDTNGTLTSLHSFSDADGKYPQAGVVQAADGNLYGTTFSGGASQFGTIFEIDRNGTTLRTLHSFTGWPSDGADPRGGLLAAPDGSFFGTASFGGPDLQGGVFRLIPNPSGRRLGPHD